jgi:hypothetical protein
MSRQNLVSNGTNTYFGYKESDGTFIQAGTTNGVWINPYRCYFYTTGGSPAKLNNIVFDDSTTGISTPTADASANTGNVYSIDGKMIESTSKLAKGVYIKNRKKIVIK